MAAAIEEVGVTLPSEQVETMRAAVESGEYATTSEIVREAILDWQQKRALRSNEVETFRRVWDEGKTSGIPRPFDIERIIDAAKARVTG